MSNPEPETYTVVSNNQRVKFFVEKHHDQLKNTNNSAQSNDAQLPSNSVDKLTSLFQNSNSNDRFNRTMDSQPNKKEVSIEMKSSNNDNNASNNFSDNTEDSPHMPLANSNIKNMELYDEYHEKPLGKFLNSILNFNSLIPPNKEINDENNSKKQQKPPNKLGTLLGVFLPCVQNIFGVILFIRASWVVGVAGSIQAFLIVLMCCSCTLLTAISTSAIATNGIVPAGGPYFMISRSLGPECGGAVGILFYLGNTVAASMYIVGAVEIFLKYLFPQLTLIGDIENQSDAFQNFRIYGTIFLIVIGLCVFIGIKFVSKLAPISLIAVVLSVICIYAGVVKSAFDPPDLKICVFNKTRLIRYDSYVSNGIAFCNNEQWCYDNKRNQSFQCPLWKAYCGSLTTNSSSATETSSALDETKKQHLCNYFKMDNSMELRQGIPGISNSRPTLENYKSNYIDEGEVYPGEKGLSEVEILGKEFTSFLILVGIYFPSVTGIMAGSNRSGDLKDPSRSIPRGTIAAVLTTSFIYLSNVLLFGSCIDGLLLRDKFGDSINKKLVISELAWPSKWIIMIGAFLSTLGAGLQSLTSAPRLLQAVSKDDIIPFLRPLTASFRGEPFRALMVTLLLTWCGILLGNVDYLTPLIAMFFLLCYGFINMACALQTLLKAPSWRPRYKFYHWTLSLLGLFLCLLIMFIVNWIYAIVAIMMAALIYKYIEYKGAEKEWGDGIRGLSMSAARYALLKLEEAPPHVKNWRPQILLLVKCVTKNETNQCYKLKQQLSDVEENIAAESKNEENEFNIEIQHPNAFAFATQLKAGKGLFVCASVVPGEFIPNLEYSKACKKHLKKTMNHFKAKGFCDILVAQSVEQGICHLIQTEGLGGLRHNTIILNWPEKWNKEYFSKKNSRNFEDEDEDENTLSLAAFVQTLRFGNANESALILTKGIDDWPANSKTDTQSGTIDLWWIIHDGGLLLLIVFLLKKHKIWQKCKLRLFTVAQEEENSIQIKNDLVQYMYFLRIDAEVEVVEMNDSEISAYTYEKTLKLHEREKLLQKLKLNEKAAEIEPQTMLQRVRQNSLKQSSSNFQIEPAVAADTDANTNDYINQFTFSANAHPRRPSVIQTETMRKMHSAVELNKKILEKSKESSLVLMNIPAPPKHAGIADYNYLAYLQASTEGLNRVLLVRGSGREVITIFS